MSIAMNLLGTCWEAVEPAGVGLPDMDANVKDAQCGSSRSDDVWLVF